MELVKTTIKKPLFNTGNIYLTPGTVELFSKLPASELPYLVYIRHGKGDWGDLSDEDKQRNDEALHDGSRIFSAYETSAGKVWIITEADRASTTILLPAEY